MASLGELLRRLPALARGPERTDDRVEAAATASTEDEASTAAVRKLLMLARAEALDAFRNAGLPDTPGPFGFDPEQGAWVPLAAGGTPASRWDHVLRHPPQTGWRYASLSHIGRRERPGDPVIALAADLLDQITSSVARLDGESGTDAAGRHDLEVAFELTMTWMRLVEATTQGAPPRPKAPPKKVAGRSRKRTAS